MPTQDEVRKPVSNDVEDFIAASIGPDQARARFKSCEYVSFDYAGQMKDDPVISVKAVLEPQDGENDNKDFEVEWTTGAKMKEFAIVENGGYLVPTQAKSTLTTGSNWALFQRSMKDCGFNTALLNGKAGIMYLAEGDGAVVIIKRIKQPERAGLSEKTPGGRDKTYYTCLKIDALPGEKRTKTKPSAAAKPAASAPASASSSQVNGSPAPASATVDASTIKSILDANGGSIKISDLQKQIFLAVKASGSPVNVCATTAKAAVQDNVLLPMAEKNSWMIDEGVLIG